MAVPIGVMITLHDVVGCSSACLSHSGPLGPEWKLIDNSYLKEILSHTYVLTCICMPVLGLEGHRSGSCEPTEFSDIWCIMKVWLGC